MSACAPAESTRRNAVHPAAQETQPQGTEVQIEATPALNLDKIVTLEKIIPGLDGKRVVFVGEHHTRYDHHLIQLEIIRRLHALQPRLAIGMEAFQQPFQDHLDDYVAGTLSEQEMLRATEYYQRWGIDYRLYAPILRYAREHRLPLVALNLPGELTRKVAREGPEALSPEEKARIPADIDRSDQAYRRRVNEVFRLHPRGKGQTFENFLEAQLLWDEGMAQRAAEFLKAHPDHQLIILAGARHVAPASAIPARLTRRLPVSTAVVLSSWDQEIEPGLADFLLMPKKRVLPPKGKMGVLLEHGDGVVKVESCTPGSACESAGMRAGDRIVSIDQAPITDVTDLHLALWDKRPGDEVTVAVERKRWFSRRKTLSYQLTLR